MTNTPLPTRPAWYRTWKLPLLLWLVAAGVIAFINMNAETWFSDGGMRFLFYFIAVGVSVIFTSLWFRFLSAASYPLRVWFMRTEIIAVALFMVMFKVESVGGNMWPPRVVPRWWKNEDFYLGKLAPEKTSQPVETKSVELPGLRDYPAFLGLNRHAVISDLKLARDWVKQPPRKLWRQPIGSGWSAFSVVGTAAVTQEQRGDEELVVCYDLPSGKLRWVHSDPGRFESTLGGDGPRATPTIHEGRVYTMGAIGWLNCLDLVTGEPIWKTRSVLADVKSTPEVEKPVVAWGRAGSPLIVDHRVIVPGGGPPTPSAEEGTYVSLIAYDKDTGEIVGTGGDQQISYSSPSLFTIGDTKQIVIVNEKTITGHDVQTLKVLWSIPWEGGSSSNASSPQTQQISADQLFVTKGYNIGGMLFQVTCEGTIWTAKKIWHNSLVLRGKLSNHVIAGDHAYGLDDGILECVDLKTGKKLWKGGRYELGQLLLVGDVLLVQAESGDVVLVEDNPKKHVELTRFEAIEGKTWNNPVLAGHYLLVRNSTEAACYELPVIDNP